MTPPASVLSTSNSPSSAFGKRLAHTDKKVRDKAVKSLIRFLSNTKELSHLEWLKLWKGLFYCFWMSDKPLIQQQLAEDLAALAGRLERKCGWAYVNAFWDTITREWTGIDRLRLDKFYLLIRKFVHHSFKLLATANWNEGEVEMYTDILSAFPLSPTNIAVPDGIRYHVTDIYVEELEKAVPINSFSSVPMTKLIAPFTTLISQTSNATVIKRVQEGVFHSIFERAEENKDMYDIPAIALELQKAAMDSLTSEVNRNRMMTLHEMFTSNCPDAVPIDVDCEESKSEDTTEDVSSEDVSNDRVDDSETNEEKDDVEVQAEDVGSDENWEDISADAAPCFDDWEPVSAKEAVEIESKIKGKVVVETVEVESTIESKPEAEPVEMEMTTESTETVFQVPTAPATKGGKKKKAKGANKTETESVAETIVSTPIQKQSETVPPSSESKRVVWRLANNTVKRFRTKSPSLSVSSCTPPDTAFTTNSTAPKSALKIRNPAETEDSANIADAEPTAEVVPVAMTRNKRKRTTAVVHLESTASRTLTPDMSPADVRRLTEYNTMKNQPPILPKRPRITVKKTRGGRKRR